VTFNYNINGSFDTQDKNFYFLQYSPDENVNSWSEAQFNQSGKYAICVDKMVTSSTKVLYTRLLA